MFHQSTFFGIYTASCVIPSNRGKFSIMRYFHFHGIVDERLRELGKSPTKLALENGLPRDAIRSVLRGHPPSVERARKIAEALGLEFYIGPPRRLDGNKGYGVDHDKEPPLQIDEERSDYATSRAMAELQSAAEVLSKAAETVEHTVARTKSMTHQAEVVELAAAAGGNTTELDETVIGHVAFSRPWLDRRGLDPARCMVIRVQGKSMEPTLPDGCSILVDCARHQRRTGHIYVLRTDDGVVVKRLTKDEDGAWHLQSDHPSWSPEPWTEACETIGEVRWMARNLG